MYKGLLLKKIDDLWLSEKICWDLLVIVIMVQSEVKKHMGVFKNRGKTPKMDGL